MYTGTAKIADVGLARIMQHTLSNTATGDPAGTFAYAAPEMLMGEKWDDKVCLWPTACILLLDRIMLHLVLSFWLIAQHTEAWCSTSA